MSSDPTAMLYAPMTQLSWTSETPKSSRIEGNATFTDDTLTTTKKIARVVTISATHACRSIGSSSGLIAELSGCVTTASLRRTATFPCPRAL